ncbi:gamma-glutamylcyclotransferase [Rhodanobacter sp. C03]|uniref:gamma-glutamylcyclotransferase n=1 Tax=Rhodanobacter sp. C03 TaxID=1945858 RepID=UPI00098497B9|nr:gamma-glutamylcyclotransferase [Rhodanobacter sp. C03]
MSVHAAARRLALATSADYPCIQPDDAHLATSLEHLGIQPIVCVWNDPDVDWSTFDAVLIRTIWDYFKHHAAFLAWLDRLDRLGVPTINDSALLRWNSDKRYLLELVERGVDIIPTRLAGAGELQDVLATMPAQPVVIKPTISGGAWHTLRGNTDDAAFLQAVDRLPRELDYLVQPFVPEVVSAGEWSLLYFEGEFSHAVLKRPASGDYRVQSEHGGSVDPIEPDAATFAAAERALAALATMGYGDLAYARIDGVVCNGRFLVMELELLEPSLFLAGQPQAAERFARQLSARLDRLHPGTAAATEYLFSYGTLQTAAVQLATFGRQLAGQPDRLDGYRRELIRIDDPQVVATSGASHHPIVHDSGNPEDSVSGTVFRLSTAELARADAYEVDDYRRVAVTLASGTRAWIYVGAAPEFFTEA